MCIYCCGAMREATIRLFLKRNEQFRDRKLEILICPNCGSLCAELTQFNIKTLKYETIRPKRKKVSKFLIKLEKENKELKLPKIKYGTKSGANWIYGVNKEKKDKICQYARKFNGLSKLVKTIDKTNYSNQTL